MHEVGVGGVWEKGLGAVLLKLSVPVNVKCRLCFRSGRHLRFCSSAKPSGDAGEGQKVQVYCDLQGSEEGTQTGGLPPLCF